MTTRAYELDSHAWTELGVTPCLLQNRSREAVGYVIGTERPAAMSAAAHILSPVGSTSIVAITLPGQRVYARGMWSASASVAFTDAPMGERHTVAALFSATALLPLAAGKLVRTFPVAGVQAGETLLATPKTPLPAGIALAGEVTVPSAGTVAIAFVLVASITSLTATPVAIELTPVARGP